MLNRAGKDPQSVKDFMQSIMQERLWDKAGVLLSNVTGAKEVLEKTKKGIRIVVITYFTLLFLSGFLTWRNLSAFVDEPTRLSSLVWGTVSFFCLMGLGWIIAKPLLPKNL
jgi:hypothetical protein